MKTIKPIIKIFTLLFILNNSGYSQQPDNWKWLNPKPQGNSLFAIDFADNYTGYSVGAYGTVLKTTNTGNEWNQLNTGTNIRLLSVDFINSEIGYFGGFNQNLKKTINGGQTWTSLQLPLEGPFDSLFAIMDINFVSPDVGFVLGFFELESKIWKTTDGGTSWTTQTTAGANYLNTLYFFDDNNGYAAGGSLGSEIIKTTNGGTTWELVQYYDYPALSDIYFFNQTTGIAAGENGCVLMTTNAGINWEQTGSPTGMDITSVLFLDNNTGFGIGSGSIYIKTTNGGLNWTVEDFGWDNIRAFMDAKITPDGSIHAIGTYGIIMRSTNGGTNWETQYTATEKTLSEIKFVNNTTGYAVCGYSSGDILKTTDAGVTWVSQINTYTTPMYGLSFTDPETGYIAGSIDIKKTTNGGTNWVNVYSSTINEIFTDVVFTNPNTGYVVGSYGKLLKTTNAGLNWSPIIISTGGSILTSICFVNESIGYAVGDNSVIVKTTDAGITWTSQSSPFTFAYLTSVDFIDENTGYISSGEGLLKTTDGGVAWNIMNAPEGGYYKIQFRNEFGYAVASNGKIVKSSDGGNNWIEQPTVTDNGLYALYFNTDNYVYAGGLLGTILKTIPTELIITNTGNNINEVTKDFFLSQNYPNPFNPVTKISFEIPGSGLVTLKVYDITGKLVDVLLNENKNKGSYTFNFNGSNLSSGIYFYTLTAQDFIQTKRMILLK